MKENKFKAWSIEHKKTYDAGVLGGKVYVDFNSNGEFEEVDEGKQEE